MYGFDYDGIQPEEVILYLRKSRTDNPELTVEEVLKKHYNRLQDWAVRFLGEKIPESNIMREIVSGETIEARPKMKELLRAIESDSVKAVIVNDIQRLSRGDLEDCGRIIKLFRYTNTIVITPEFTFDLQNVYDRDNFEREIKRGSEYLEYQKKIMSNGRFEAVKQGNYISSVPPYGYNKIAIREGKNIYHTLEENKSEADIVRYIYDLYVNQGMGFAKIARRLNELQLKPRTIDKWYSGSVKQIVGNIHHIGKVKWNHRKSIKTVQDGELRKTRPKSDDYLIFEGKHEGIVSEELFHAAQEKRGKNERVVANKELKNPLAGILFCSCGYSITWRKFKNRNNETRYLCNNQVNCHTGSILESELIEQIVKILKDCISDFEISLNSSSETKTNKNVLSVLEKRLEELERKEISQWEKYSEEKMPKYIFDTLNDKVLKEKEEVKKAIVLSQTEETKKINFENKIKLFSDAIKALENPEVPAKSKNMLLKQCFEKIIYHRARPIRIKGKKGIGSSPLWISGEVSLDVVLRV
jgi:hypothetical protein